MILYSMKTQFVEVATEYAQTATGKKCFSDSHASPETLRKIMDVKDALKRVNTPKNCCNIEEMEKNYATQMALFIFVITIKHDISRRYK